MYLLSLTNSFYYLLILHSLPVYISLRVVHVITINVTSKSWIFNVIHYVGPAGVRPLVDWPEFSIMTQAYSESPTKAIKQALVLKVLTSLQCFGSNRPRALRRSVHYRLNSHQFFFCFVLLTTAAYTQSWEQQVCLTRCQVAKLEIKQPTKAIISSHTLGPN